MYLNKISKKKELLDMENLFDLLWPLNRSITGNDVRKTHKIIKKFIPIKTFEVKSKTRVNDWIVPLEWNVKEAYISNSNNEKIIDFKNNNLHLMSYSIPINKKINLKKLKKNLHYIKKIPNAIPYKTTYYKRDWGFCLSYNQYKKLKEDIYHVVINSELKNGSLTYSDYLIPGKSKREILFHTYTCHPSMANNELSGPILTTFLAKRLKKGYFSYRFVFAPETIGAIAYLKKKGNYLKNKLIGGLVLTCCGIKNYLTYKKNKIPKNFFDKIFINQISKNKFFKYKILSFDPYGSDHRQYCSIGYNLPVSTIMSKSYNKYKEYHTSFDTKNIISFKHMQKILDFICQSIQQCEKSKNIFESNKKIKNQKKLKNKIIKNNPIIKIKNGEPMFSRHNIHYKSYNYKDADKLTLASKWVVHFSDGKHSIKDISKLSKIKFHFIKKASANLKKAKILS